MTSLSAGGWTVLPQAGTLTIRAAVSGLSRSSSGLLAREELQVSPRSAVQLQNDGLRGPCTSPRRDGTRASVSPAVQNDCEDHLLSQRDEQLTTTEAFG